MPVHDDGPIGSPAPHIGIRWNVLPPRRLMSASEPVGSSVPPPWFKDSVIYELHLRAFYDANGDGIGDFAGATEKLDYLVELGVTAVWLLPFYPSPLRDAGYDISDYCNVHPIYGTLEDFRRFLDAAHARGLRVITELVLNHTSDQHPWFVASRRSPPGTPERSRYVWSTTDDRYRGVRIIFRDSERSNWTWDPEAGAYFWHRFYHHQPDLNYDDPTTERAIQDVAAFWFQLGVDGLRLDAAPYLCEREGTNSENLPETHAILRRLRSALDQRFEGRVLLAEANQWPDDAAAYFGRGDECHMAFHFPLMPRMFMSLQLEDRRPLVDILEATPPIPGGCQWALFLRNHDELTLEMVTDEERDYMYRSYARDARGRLNLGIRRRLAPLMGSDRRKIELMQLLLFTLPGTPVLYYGDEILMGDNDALGDRDSVRTPMQWDRRRNAGFSRARTRNLYLPLVSNPQYRFEVVNVESQRQDLDSHLWWLKRLIRMRRKYTTFGRGDLELLHSENPRVFAFLRRGGEDLLVVVNLSHATQSVDLPLAGFEDRVPVDLFGGTRFPPVRRGSLSLALGPYGYYTLLLASSGAPTTVPGAPNPYELRLGGGPSTLWSGPGRAKMESEVLPAYLFDRPWFEAGGRRVEFVRVRDPVVLDAERGGQEWVTVVDVFFLSGPPDTYALPFAAVPRATDPPDTSITPGDVVAGLQIDGAPWVLRDGLGAIDLTGRLEALALRGGSIPGAVGVVRGVPGPGGGEANRPEGPESAPSAEPPPHFTFRRHLLEGFDTEVEVARHFSARRAPGILPLLGTVVYAERGASPLTLATVSVARPNAIPLARRYEAEVARFLGAVRAPKRGPPEEVMAALAEGGPIPPRLTEAMGTEVLGTMAGLGERIAALHRTLLEGTEVPELASAPFDYLYQTSLAYSMGAGARRLLDELASARQRGPLSASDIDPLLDDPGPLLDRFRALRGGRFDSVRLVVHGDLSLERVLVDGEALWVTGWGRGRAVAKRSPLRDVARLLRSLQEVADRGAAQFSGTEVGRPVAVDLWVRAWYQAAATTFRTAYEAATSGTSLVPSDPAARQQLLEVFLLDGCVGDLLGSLRKPAGRPELPLRLIYDILGSGAGPVGGPLTGRGA